MNNNKKCRVCKKDIVQEGDLFYVKEKIKGIVAGRIVFTSGFFGKEWECRTCFYINKDEI